MPEAAPGGMLDVSLDRVLDKVPELRGSRRVEELPGGLTNRNYKVTTAAGRFVVRLSTQDAGLLAIDRRNEHANSVAAAETGIGAPVVAFLPDDGVLVVRYIDGVTLTDASFAGPGLVGRVASSCRRLHGGPRFVNDFDMFRVQRSYLALVQRRGFRLPPDYLGFAPQVDRMKAALAVRAEPTVPCHNDLLAANLIDNGERIWLIDYEYAGNNDACFDLGNLSSECHFDLAQQEELVTSYYGRSLRHKLARCRLQGLLATYGWTLWASIQDATSPLEFDFWTWGMEKYESAVAMFRSAEFERLLDDVQRAD